MSVEEEEDVEERVGFTEEEEAGRLLRQRLANLRLAQQPALSLPLGAVQWLLRQPQPEELASSCTHLRVTGDPWPLSSVRPTRRSANPSANVTHKTLLLRAVFPNLRSVWFDGVAIAHNDVFFSSLEGISVLRIDGVQLRNDGAREYPSTPRRISLQRGEVIGAPPSILAAHCPHPHSLVVIPTESNAASSFGSTSYNAAVTPLATVQSLRWSSYQNPPPPSMIRNTLPPLKMFASLRHLDLSHNRLSALPVDALDASVGGGTLRHLNLSHNRLTSLAGLEPCGLPALHTLHVSHNRLTDAHDAARRLAQLLPHLQELVLLPGNPWSPPEMTYPGALAVLVWQACCERQKRSEAPTALPRIDGAVPNARQWRTLRRRVPPIRPLRLPSPVPPSTRRRRRRRSFLPAAPQYCYVANAMRPTFSLWDIMAAACAEETKGAVVEEEDGHETPVPDSAAAEELWQELEENLGLLYLDAAASQRRNAAPVPRALKNQSVSSGNAASSSLSLREDEEVPNASPLLHVNGRNNDEIKHEPLILEAQPVGTDQSTVDDDDKQKLLSPDPSVEVLSTPEKSLASREDLLDEASIRPGSDALPSPVSLASTPTLALRVSSFSESQWPPDEDLSPPSSANASGVAPLRPEVHPWVPQKATYDGPRTYRSLRILENLELYFRLFVFASSAADDDEENWQEAMQSYPRIQLWPVDRSKREEIRRRKNEPLLQFDLSNVVRGHRREVLHRVWNEKVVACGKAALRRLTPSRAARYGFHGELLWSAAESSHMRPDVVVECRETICCLSDSFLYLIVNHDSVTSKPMKDPKRDFPRPIPASACFQEAKWPHALACHALESLTRISIGFGFQRLTLYFQDSNASESFVYIFLTCNKLETIALLKLLQELTSPETETIYGTANNKIKCNVRIENDDPLVLDSFGSAMAPEPVGVVVHYQILQQRWKSGARGSVRRVCVVTDTKLFLLDEDYVGDGSESIDANLNGRPSAFLRSTQLGDCLHRLVDSSDLHQIAYLQPADSDPNAVTIVMKPAAALKRRHYWRLVCRDGQGAERLVEDVRKAISNL